VLPRVFLWLVEFSGVTAERNKAMLWKGFQRPKRLEFERETLTDRFGRFYAQPFERGFGTTVGNALRRRAAVVD
jgi:hypothetical protein